MQFCHLLFCETVGLFLGIARLRKALRLCHVNKVPFLVLKLLKVGRHTLLGQQVIAVLDGFKPKRLVKCGPEVFHRDRRLATFPLACLCQCGIGSAEPSTFLAHGVGCATVALCFSHSAVTDPGLVHKVGVFATERINCPGFGGARNQFLVIAPVILAQRIGIFLVDSLAGTHAAYALDGGIDLVAALIAHPIGSAHQKPLRFLVQCINAQGLVLQNGQQHGAHGLSRPTSSLPFAAHVVVQGVNPLMVDRAIAARVGQVDDLHGAAGGGVGSLEMGRKLAVTQRANSEVNPHADIDSGCAKVLCQIHEGVIRIVQMVLIPLGTHPATKPYICKSKSCLKLGRRDIFTLAMVGQVVAGHTVQFGGAQRRLAVRQCNAVLFFNEHLRPVRRQSQPPEIVGRTLKNVGICLCTGIGELGSPGICFGRGLFRNEVFREFPRRICNRHIPIQERQIGAHQR